MGSMGSAGRDLQASRALQVILEFARSSAVDDPFAFAGGRQAYSLRRPGGGYDRFEISWDDELLERLLAVSRPGCPPALAQRLGETLRDLLSRTSWSAADQAITAAVARGELITVTIRSAAAELYSLPWELLTLRSTGQRIGGVPGVLVRYEWPETTSAPDTSDGERGWRIAVAWSAAAGAVPSDDHLDALAQAAALSEGVNLDRARDELADVSLAQLDRHLDEAASRGAPYSALHLLCHGQAEDGGFGLAMRRADGSVDTVSAARLQQVLGRHAGATRLVVLMACDSSNSGALAGHLGSVAQMLHRAGVEHVIGSRYPISADSSTRFTAVFYGALLGSTASVESAFLAARVVLQREPDELCWASLQLYSRAAGPSASRSFTGLKIATGARATGPGTLLGDDRYLLVQQLDQSGLSSLWLARDTQLSRSVALKLLRRDAVAGDEERMFRGPRLLAGIEHPGLARVLEPAGVDGDARFVVFEFINGGDLQTAVLEGRVPPARAVPVVEALCEVMAALHARGLTHNHITPANVMLRSSGAPLLVDLDAVADDRRPADDVHALARLVAFVLYGRELPSGPELRPAWIAQLSCEPGLQQLLIDALCPSPTSPVYPDAGALHEALRGVTRRDATALTITPPPTASVSTRRGALLGALGAGAALVLAALLLMNMSKKTDLTVGAPGSTREDPASEEEREEAPLKTASKTPKQSTRAVKMVCQVTAIDNSVGSFTPALRSAMSEQGPAFTKCFSSPEYTPFHKDHPRRNYGGSWYVSVTGKTPTSVRINSQSGDGPTPTSCMLTVMRSIPLPEARPGETGRITIHCVNKLG